MSDSPGILQCTPMRGAGSNTPPAFTMPAGACDSHFHVFEPGYPHVSNPQYTFPDGPIGQYAAVAEFLGIERMVLVQPSFYGTDNSLLAYTLKRLGPRCGGVIQIEEDVTDAELGNFHEIGVRAVRLDLFARRDWPARDLAAYITRMAKRVTPRGWHLQFYTPGTIVRDLLPFLADLRDEPWIISPETAIGRLTLAMCLAVGFDPEIAATVDDTGTALGLVSIGWGITIAPQLTPAGTDLHVTRIPIAGMDAARHSSLIVRDGDHLSPVIAAAIAAVRAVSTERWAGQRP